MRVDPEAGHIKTLLTGFDGAVVNTGTGISMVVIKKPGRQSESKVEI